MTADQCARFIEIFASEYVRVWEPMQGDRAKAQGHAIMSAAAALRIAIATEKSKAMAVDPQTIAGVVENPTPGRDPAERTAQRDALLAALQVIADYDRNGFCGTEARAALAKVQS